MLATLCSYESWFGPYHPQTLRLRAQVAIGHWQAWEPHQARSLLERVVQDLDRHLTGEQDVLLRAIATLRDIVLAQGDYERSASVQKELLECQTACLGSDHLETISTRAALAVMLLESLSTDSDKQI